MFKREKRLDETRAAAGTLLVAVILLAWLPAPATAQLSNIAEKPVVSLRVESRTVVPNAQGVVQTSYRLVNDSPKPIVAWELGCVTARQDGQAVHGQVGYDAYAGYERFRLQHLPVPAEVIEPGKFFEQTISYSPSDLDGPMAGKTCGPVLVIFDDATYEGLTVQAEHWFRSRFRSALDNHWGREALANALEETEPGKPLAEILESLTAQSTRPQAGAGRSFSAGTFIVYRDHLRRGQPLTAKEVLADLDFQFQAAMAHLPQSWREKVLTEIGQ